MSDKASSSSLVDEREQVMVSEKGSTLKKTHFLKPSIDDGDLVAAELPRRRRGRLSVSSSSGMIKLFSSKISFSGFWFSDGHFVSWLSKMEALHEPTWRKAGIFEAIKASTHNIAKSQSLILSVAEKWCPETKSFLFPFGEADTQSFNPIIYCKCTANEVGIKGSNPQGPSVTLLFSRISIQLR